MFCPPGPILYLWGKTGLTGETIYTRLKQKGILVRYFNIEGIKNFVRITVGTEKEIEALMTSIRALF